MTGLVDRLEHAGWVRRERDPADRRRVIVALAPTPDQGAALWALYQPLAEAMTAYRDRLGARDLAMVVEFLQFANAAVAASTERARDLRAAGHGAG